MSRNGRYQPGVRLWIGNDPDPARRRQIVVSRSDNARIPPDNARIPPRGAKRGRVTVTDQLTGKDITLRRISCGLPTCYCALGEVKR